MKGKFFLLIGLCCCGVLTTVGHYGSAFAAQTFDVTEPAKDTPDLVLCQWPPPIEVLIPGHRYFRYHARQDAFSPARTGLA